jgi:DMSO/TMAO reductase YedYZ molybdopterin-dependent catalytic subunit
VASDPVRGHDFPEVVRDLLPISAGTPTRAQTGRVTRLADPPRPAAVRRQSGFAALAGLASAAVALGVAELLAVPVGARSAPLVAVGGVVVDSVPGWLKNLAVAIFYTYDKVALLTGMTVVLAVFAVGVGLAATRRLGYGLAGVVLLGLVGAVAAGTRAGATWLYPVPSLVGAVAGAAALHYLVARLPTAPAEDRRRFLKIAGGVLGGGLVVGITGRWLSARRSVSVARSAVKLPAPADPAPALPGAADFGQPDLSRFVTTAGDFYRIDTALSVPQVDPAAWTLTIKGRVANPMTITYQQLLARPMIERYVTLACVSNEVGGELIGNARWLGVPIKDLLDEARPQAGADQLVSTSVDGFTAGTPTAVLRDGRDAMLAVGMNGAPLPIEHGFPVRMVVPGLYGYVSATKWLAEWELTSFGDFDAYWIRRGWSQQAPIKTESRIDTPRDGAGRKSGRVVVAGVAWAQHRGISKVEVRVDDGPWQAATLAAVPSIDTWRQWMYEWDARPGTHRLTVRATDNGGATQTEDEAPPAPDGATGWHHIDVDIS